MLLKITPLILRFVISSVLLAFLHYLLVQYTTLSYDVPELFEAYFFVVVIHLISYIITVRISSKHFDKTGFAFSGLTFVKMGFTIAYLWPMIRQNGEQNIEQLIQFFVIYFIFLFMEAQAVFKLLNRGETP